MCADLLERREGLRGDVSRLRAVADGDVFEGRQELQRQLYGLQQGNHNPLSGRP